MENAKQIPQSQPQLLRQSQDGMRNIQAREMQRLQAILWRPDTDVQGHQGHATHIPGKTGRNTEITEILQSQPNLCHQDKDELENKGITAQPIAQRYR